MAGFYGSLCLSDIPKELITVGKNGKKYLNIEVGERRQTSQYGATHYVKASVKAEQKREGVNYFIGDLKPSKYNNDPEPQPVAEEYTAPQPAESQEGDPDDLPF